MEDVTTSPAGVTLFVYTSTGCWASLLHVAKAELAAHEKRINDQARAKSTGRDIPRIQKLPADLAQAVSQSQRARVAALLATNKSQLVRECLRSSHLVSCIRLRDVLCSCTRMIRLVVVTLKACPLTS